MVYPDVSSEGIRAPSTDKINKMIILTAKTNKAVATICIIGTPAVYKRAQIAGLKYPREIESVRKQPFQKYCATMCVAGTRRAASIFHYPRIMMYEIEEARQCSPCM